MCDFVSWVEKDGDLYWLEDDEIEAKWGYTVDYCQKIGHAAIREYFGLKGGRNKESVMQLPVPILKSVRAGKMRKMMEVGGYKELDYDSQGHLTHYKTSNGFESWRDYDSQGRLTHRKGSNGSESWYDSQGHLTHLKSSDGFEEWYDSRGHLTRYKSPNGSETWWDSRGNVIAPKKNSER